MGPVPGLCLLAKRRERRFPEAGQSIAKPRSADYPKIRLAACEGVATLRHAAVAQERDPPPVDRVTPFFAAKMAAPHTAVTRDA